MEGLWLHLQRISSMTYATICDESIVLEIGWPLHDVDLGDKSCSFSPTRHPHHASAADYVSRRVSTLFATLFLINHCRIERIESKSGSKPWVGSAGLHLGLGLSSCICLALMATVPVSELPVQHVLFVRPTYSLNRGACLLDVEMLPFSGESN